MENQTQEKQQSEWRNRELGALWVRQGKGQKYLTGHLEIETMPGVNEKVKVVVFSNKGKQKNENAPDYVVYRSQPAQDSAAEATTSTAEATSNELPEALV